MRASFALNTYVAEALETRLEQPLKAAKGPAFSVVYWPPASTSRLTGRPSCSDFCSSLGQKRKNPPIRRVFSRPRRALGKAKGSMASDQIIATIE